MKLLCSNIPPLRSKNGSFSDSFEGLLEETESLKIASGYISTDSITELKKIVEGNKGPYVDLIIGMHYFEGITKTQYEATKYLDDYLRSSSLGKVSIITTFKFHGKLYSFCKDSKPFACVMGSSNLNSILNNHRNFETDILLNETEIINEINNFIINLDSKTAKPFGQWIPESFKTANPLLDGVEGVEGCSPEELTAIWDTRTNVEFEIPLKASEKHQKSNLNVYFGKGRENKRGFVKPRHWYEVELIVPNRVTSHPKYPKAGCHNEENVITVYTNDGWKFDCKTSGDFSKNFRSTGDLKILGKWIKGKLENTGVLQVGKPVTEEVLDAFGKNHFKLIETNDSKIWLLEL